MAVLNLAVLSAHSRRASTFQSASPSDSSATLVLVPAVPPLVFSSLACFPSCSARPTRSVLLLRARRSFQPRGHQHPTCIRTITVTRMTWPGIPRRRTTQYKSLPFCQPCTSYPRYRHPRHTFPDPVRRDACPASTPVNKSLPGPVAHSTWQCADRCPPVDDHSRNPLGCIRMSPSPSDNVLHERR